MAPVCGLSASTLEFTFDTTRAIAALIFSGVVRDFPGIIPHGIGAELRKLYFDTALSAHRATFSTLLALVPAQNVLFGSDYPFGPRNQIEDAVERLEGLGLPASDQASIGRENAVRLFPRFSGG